MPEANAVAVPEANAVAVPEANAVAVSEANAVAVPEANAVAVPEANAVVVPEANTVAVPEVISLSDIVNDTPCANVQVPAPLENIIANGQAQQLEELDALIANIMAEIESGCDEGIALSPHHELEVEPLYYNEEIEGLDDIELDMPLNLLEAELEIELENF